MGVSADLYAIASWWLMLVFFGLAGWQISSWLFPKWEDGGYLMAKASGVLFTTYLVWILGSGRILEYNRVTILICALVVGVGTAGLKKRLKIKKNKINWRLIIAEEILFLTALTGWAWVKAHEPSINGLEKFMDYGFTRSIQRTQYFPPQDMWFAGESINYYYFGHLTMASLSLVSGVDLDTGFDLMLATLFALCLTMSFAISRELLTKYPAKIRLGGAALTAVLVTLSGNLHTVYAFTQGYWGAEDNPPPFWEIWQPVSNFKNWPEGFGNYWYPNATRFIPYTIHEFPAYSFVVSDIHGHVLSIPIVLFLIAMLVQFFSKQQETAVWQAGVYGLIAGTALMTNALDGPIYLGLFALTLLVFNFKISHYKKPIILVVIAGTVFIISVLPFLINFKPFVNGVAVNCPPAVLADRKIGPLIFEETDKCQKSPIWMMLVLWGFFLYNALALGWVVKNNTEPKRLLVIWTGVSFLLIIFAEFFYFKDIYPQHFRSNTMFKLGYQAFILMSIVSGYTITRIIAGKAKGLPAKIYLLGLAPLLILVLMYPYFAVKSYFNDLKDYRGLYGLEWMQEKYPDYYMAVRWLNQNVSGQPVILEAAGDSYTDSDLVSAFTGLPTVAGWAVHEWLWRGGYDPVAKRSADVATIFGSGDQLSTQFLLNKYKVKYIIVGDMERKKYPDLDVDKIGLLANPVFVHGTTTIYRTKADN